MGRKNVPVKTSEGAQEIKARALGLAPRIRTALLLVDGVKSVAELERLMTAAGVTAGALQLLLDKGLIRFQDDASVEPAVAEVAAQETPTRAVPAEENQTPGAPEPAQVTVKEVPTEEIPVVIIPAAEIPAEEIQIQETPARELPDEEVPIEEVPAKVAPVEVDPYKEFPDEETPAEEAPLEEDSVKEIPVIEIPAKEKPSAEIPIVPPSPGIVSSGAPDKISPVNEVGNIKPLKKPGNSLDFTATAPATNRAQPDLPAVTHARAEKPMSMHVDAPKRVNEGAPVTAKAVSSRASAGPAVSDLFPPIVLAALKPAPPSPPPPSPPAKPAARPPSKSLEVVPLVELETILGFATKMEMDTILGVATKLELTPTQILELERAADAQSPESHLPPLAKAERDYRAATSQRPVIPAAVLHMNLTVARAHLANALDEYLEIEGYALKQKVVACDSRSELEQLFRLVEGALTRKMDRPAAARVMGIAQSLLER